MRERLFLPRKPGVFAYAASTIVAMYSLMSPQRKMAEQLTHFVFMSEVYMRIYGLSNIKNAGHCSALIAEPEREKSHVGRSGIRKLVVLESLLGCSLWSLLSSRDPQRAQIFYGITQPWLSTPRAGQKTE